MNTHTERDILDALHRRYNPAVGNGGIRYIVAEHVRNAAGFYAQRTADMIVQDTWPASGNELIGHEVKVSRSDFLTELRDPAKAEAFRPFCDRWFLVVSDRSIVKTGELPKGWGLLALAGDALRMVHRAPRNDPQPLTRQMQACLLRATYKTAARRLAVVG
jgi:hypothetical protein